MDDLLRQTDYVADAQDWLGSAHGTNEAESITLDLALFDTASDGDFPNGFIPSGVVLGKVTATGLYGPYAGGDAVNERQTITRTATGGTVDLTFDGETAAAVSIVAATTAAQVRAILESLSNIDPGDVVVAGDAGGPFVVTFSGAKFAGEDVPAIAIDDTNATGGEVTVAVTEEGAGETEDDGRETAAGHLFTPVRVREGATRAVGALYWHGSVVEAKLPAASGLNAAAKAELSQIRYR